MRPQLLCTFALFWSATSAISLTGCAQPKPKVRAELNREASLLGNLPASPLHWKVITSSIDPNHGTMSTLYGNDVAVAYARSHTDHSYPVGSILSLVTWSQKEDVRWFGAWIPNHVQSVEFVFLTAAPETRPHYSYQEYTGSPLTKSASAEASVPNARAAYILSQRAAVIP